jgi:DNA-binding response OmpR family regulator
MRGHVRVALVIEDDIATRRVIARALLAAGYGVCESFVADPIPFVPALDVIVSDVVTRPDPLAVRDWTRSLRERFGVPLVLVTGRDEILALGPLALGVADVVAKPFDVSDLALRVGRAIASFQAELPPVRWA